MNEKHIKAIEKEFAITLPNGYRRMLASPPKLFMALLKCDEAENPGQIPFEPPSVADESSSSKGSIASRDQPRPDYALRIRLILYAQIVASVITGLAAAGDTRRLQMPVLFLYMLMILTQVFLPLLFVAFPLVLYFIFRDRIALSNQMGILLAAALSSALHWIAMVPLFQ